MARQKAARLDNEWAAYTLCAERGTNPEGIVMRRLGPDHFHASLLGLSAPAPLPSAPLSA